MVTRSRGHSVDERSKWVSIFGLAKKSHKPYKKEEKTLSGKNLLESFPMLNAFNVRIR